MPKNTISSAFKSSLFLSYLVSIIVLINSHTISFYYKFLILKETFIKTSLYMFM